jgi:hypothetical protein
MITAMPHPIIPALAFTTLAAAIVSAIYWFKSAAIPTPQFEEPIASVGDVPEQHIINAVANAGILHRAIEESARLNKHAAIWTGISALLGAFTTASGVLS